MQCPEWGSVSIHSEYMEELCMSGLSGGVCQYTVNTCRTCVCTVLNGGVCQYTVNIWRACKCSVLGGGVSQYTVNTRRNCACSVLSGGVCQHCEYMKGAVYAVS
jgi:hypothetical protein